MHQSCFPGFYHFIVGSRDPKEEVFLLFLPCVIIYLTLFSCQSFRDTLNPHLPLEFFKPECERGLRIGLNISCFMGCIPIGVDNKATAVELL